MGTADILNAEDNLPVRLLIGTVFATQLVFGTSVIVEWSPSLVTIGVDGKGTYRSQGKETSIPSCKALQVGNTVYVAAGDIPRRLKQDVLQIKDWFTADASLLTSSPLVADLQETVSQNRIHDPAHYTN